TTLFYPFVRNGETGRRRLEGTQYIPIVKTLLESERCRGIITHIRSTADALPRLFHSDIIARKVAHVPMGVDLPRRWQTQEMDELMRDSHVFLLPAARIHVVSVLKAMAYGQVLVASDGWGFAEYVEHGRNGLIVPGRLGKTSWADPASGMLCEDYEPTRAAD